MQKLVLLMLFILPSAYTVNTDLNFDFSGHKLLSKLLVSSCTDIVKQANKAFGKISFYIDVSLDSVDFFPISEKLQLKVKVKMTTV